MSAESQVISDDEAKALGLPPVKEALAQSQKISDEEAAQLGLPPAKAALRKGPDYLDRVMADQQKMQPKMWGALASGAHGAAAGLEGPINGVLAGAGEDLKNIFRTGSPDPGKALDAYRAERDRIVREQEPNLRDFPHAPIVGAAMTGAAGQAPTLLGRLGMSLAQGGAYGLGTSKADLTKGEVGPALRDTGIGMGFGLAGGLAGEGLNAAAGGLTSKLSSVLAKNRGVAESAAEKAFASARGAYGGEVSSAARTLEVLEKAASDPSLPEDVSRAAAEFLDGPEAAALRVQVARSSIGRGSDQLARIQTARDAMAEAGQGLQPDAVDAAARARLDNPGPLLRRLREVLPKVALPAIGGAVAGPAGAGAGALSSAVLGRSATTVRNMLADPYVSSRLLGAGAATTGGGGALLSKGGAPFDEYLRLLEEEKAP